MGPVRPPTFPPRPWPAIARRAFATSLPSGVGNRGPVNRRLPQFHWRKPFKSFPRPSVILLTEESAANSYLESITSKRLTLEADTGFSVQPGVGLTRDTTYAEGIISIADGEGVFILHLAQMKRAPEMLLSILADPTIEKQGLLSIPGFWYTIRKRESDFFRGIEPRNLLDLRSLAANLHPRLDKIESGLSGKAFMVEYAKDGLGMSLTIPTAPVNTYAVKRLAGDTIDALVDGAWLSHIAGSLLRSRLEAKVREAFGKDLPRFVKDNAPGEEEMRMAAKILVEKTLDTYRIDAVKFSQDPKLAAAEWLRR